MADLTVVMNQAIRNNDLNKVKETLQDPDFDVNAERPDDVNGPIGTPLYNACTVGNVEMVRLLLADPRIDVNRTVMEFTSALHSAITGYCGHKIVSNPEQNRKSEDDLQIINMLLDDSRLDINAQTARRQPIFYYVASMGKNDLLLLIMNKRPEVDVNIRYVAYGMTPLMIAAYFGNVETVDFLLRSPHVSVYDQNNEGKTAGDIVLDQMKKSPGWKDVQFRKILHLVTNH